ncbi:MAG: pyridoxamine 5'-phosphate oxidase [Endozoicomonas sp. (ex Botrylloides leachii)]|nr:pyridoxamine 5'-phosphate oxidase [Endozoicomonas sp. (ex Botrylloides leachii)]
MEISHLRREYTQAGLSLEHLAKTPFEQFAYWFRQTQQAGIPEPNAMSLATASREGIPSVRTVLLKHFSDNGFVFFTNYTSKKALDITENPQAALLFPWLTLERQVIVRGSVEKITKTESLRYFASRPRDSQLGAWVSRQSSVITSRQSLEVKLNAMKQKFSEGEVPLPSFWGGYRVIPNHIEFWQGRPNRLHDRFIYSKIDSNKPLEQWKIERLSP